MNPFTAVTLDVSPDQLTAMRQTLAAIKELDAANSATDYDKQDPAALWELLDQCAEILGHLTNATPCPHCARQLCREPSDDDQCAECDEPVARCKCSEEGPCASCVTESRDAAQDRAAFMERVARAAVEGAERFYEENHQ